MRGMVTYPEKMWLYFDREAEEEYLTREVKEELKDQDLSEKEIEDEAWRRLWDNVEWFKEDLDNVRIRPYEQCIVSFSAGVRWDILRRDWEAVDTESRTLGEVYEKAIDRNRDCDFLRAFFDRERGSFEMCYADHDGSFKESYFLANLEADRVERFRDAIWDMGKKYGPERAFQWFLKSYAEKKDNLWQLFRRYAGTPDRDITLENRYQ